MENLDKKGGNSLSNLTNPDRKGQDQKGPDQKVDQKVDKDKKELEEIQKNVLRINPRNPNNYKGIGLGVEITTPGFEGRNIDHHGEHDTPDTPSAIEQALNFDLDKIPEGKIATVRPDPDSCGAVAVLMLRKEGKQPDSKLVHAIGLLDRMGPGVFKNKGQELLNLSPEEFEKISKEVEAASYRIGVQRASFAEGILFMKRLLTHQIDEEEINKISQKNKEELAEVRAKSKIEKFAGGKAVFIESQARRSMEIGYEYAPIVVAYNPEFHWRGGVITSKYSIARYDKNIPLDMKGLLAELRKRNLKWGGLENIIGSPQEEDPQISPEKMKKLVEKFIVKEKK